VVRKWAASGRCTSLEADRSTGSSYGHETMTPPSLGNVLYRLVAEARRSLFDQGELAQLTYGAFDVVAGNLSQSEDNTIEVSFPIGYSADKTPLLGKKVYVKSDLLGRYQHLAFQQLPVNGIVQLVTIMEALLSDVVRAVVSRYPQKIGAKRAVQLQVILEARSIEEVHRRAADALLNELSYKSPSEFAEALKDLLSINLLESPSFHKYVELKASRDVHIHSRGVANDTYVRKAGSHARARSGHHLVVDVHYFLESYEACLQLMDWLEVELHSRWHSSEMEAFQSRQYQQPGKEALPASSDQSNEGQSSQKAEADAHGAASEGQRSGGHL